MVNIYRYNTHKHKLSGSSVICKEYRSAESKPFESPSLAADGQQVAGAKKADRDLVAEGGFLALSTRERDACASLKDLSFLRMAVTSPSGPVAAGT